MKHLAGLFLLFCIVHAAPQAITDLSTILLPTTASSQSLDSISVPTSSISEESLQPSISPSLLASATNSTGIRSSAASSSATVTASAAAASAVDTSTGDGQETDNWRAEPRGRGTFRVIFGCVLTLFLCVWTTVQVNIEPIFNFKEPQGGGPKWFKNIDEILAKRPVRKMGWSLATLFLPEVTMTIAAFERKTAWLLQREMKKVRETHRPPSSDETESEPCCVQGEEESDPWDDLSLSCYIVMGGLRISYPNANRMPNSVGILTSIWDTEREKGFQWHDDQTGSGTLTPHGVLVLAKEFPELLHSFSLPPEYIKDKSKVNALAKILVLFQAGWMIIQVIARTVSGLYVTALELHTVLQTVCAFTTYVTFWQKPVDVDLATEIVLTEEQFNYLVKVSDGHARPNPTNPLSPINLSVHPEKAAADRRFVTSRAGFGKLMFQQLWEHEQQRKENRSIIIRYFEFLGQAFGRICSARKNLWPEGICLGVVGMVFGGTHLAVWRNRFPTEVEKWMWRASSIILALSMACFYAQLAFGALVEEIAKWLKKRGTNTGSPSIPGPEEIQSSPRAEFDEKINDQIAEISKAEAGARDSSSSEQKQPSKVEEQSDAPKYEKDSITWRMYKAFIGFTFGFGLVVVLMARLFIIVECFFSLRQLPVGAYQSIQWVEVWPHFG